MLLHCTINMAMLSESVFHLFLHCLSVSISDLCLFFKVQTRCLSVPSMPSMISWVPMACPNLIVRSFLKHSPHPPPFLKTFVFCPDWDGRLSEQKIRALIGIRDSKYHHQRRRPWTRAFNTPSLKDYRSLLAKRTNQLVEALAESAGGVVDLALWISYFS